jgi:hypothetical protein
MQQSFVAAPSSFLPSSWRASSAPVEDSQAIRLNSPEDSRDEEAQAMPQYQNNGIDEEGIDDNNNSIGFVVAETPQYAFVDSIQMQSAHPSEWESISPNIIIKWLKAISPDTISSLKMRKFYKSYPTWDKMTQDQKNKALAWYCSLPEALQGMFNVI